MTKRPLYMISIVSQMLSIHPQTIRQYERMGLLKPSRTDGNKRLYSDDDIKTLKIITHLTKEVGVNIAGVEIIMAMKAEMDKLKNTLDELQERLNDQMPRGVVKINLKK